MSKNKDIVINSKHKVFNFDIKKIVKKEEKLQKEKISWEQVRVTTSQSDVYNRFYVGDVTEKYGIGGAFPSLAECESTLFALACRRIVKKETTMVITKMLGELVGCAHKSDTLCIGKRFYGYSILSVSMSLFFSKKFFNLSNEFL